MISESQLKISTDCFSHSQIRDVESQSLKALASNQLRSRLKFTALLTKLLQRQQSGMRMSPSEKKTLSKILARARAVKKKLAKQKTKVFKRTQSGGFRVH